MQTGESRIVLASWCRGVRCSSIGTRFHLWSCLSWECASNRQFEWLNRSRNSLAKRSQPHSASSSCNEYAGEYVHSHSGPKSRAKTISSEKARLMLINNKGTEKWEDDVSQEIMVFENIQCIATLAVSIETKPSN